MDDTGGSQERWAMVSGGGVGWGIEHSVCCLWRNGFGTSHSFSVRRYACSWVLDQALNGPFVQMHQRRYWGSHYSSTWRSKHPAEGLQISQGCLGLRATPWGSAQVATTPEMWESPMRRPRILVYSRSAFRCRMLLVLNMDKNSGDCVCFSFFWRFSDRSAILLLSAVESWNCRTWEQKIQVSEGQRVHEEGTPPQP